MYSLPQHEQRLEKLAQELEYFHELVEKMNQHKNEQYAKVQERNAELQVKKDKMSEIESRIQGLIDTIARQEYTKEDVHQLERKRDRLEESLGQLMKKREEYETVTVKSEIDLKREVERLERFVGPYNANIKELPIDQKYDNGVDDDVDVDVDVDVAVTNITVEKEMTHEKEQKWLLGQVDLKNEVVPMLRKMEQKYLEETTKLRTKSYQLLDHQAKAEEDLVELKDRERVCIFISVYNQSIFFLLKNAHKFLLTFLSFSSHIVSQSKNPLSELKKRTGKKNRSTKKLYQFDRGRSKLLKKRSKL